MQFVITFLEGFISFISPCMLPMLPLYISYFAGETNKKHKTFIRALAFVLGFTVVFTSLGVFAGTLGAFLVRYQSIVNIVTGLIVILLGLSYLEVIHLPFFKGIETSANIKSVFSAFLFGMIYSISLTPCVGAFLGSALMMAASSGTAIYGMILLLVYSLGLGIPFLISAVLIDKLTNAFNVIKKHYKVVNVVCGVFLIVIGIMMMFGVMGIFMNLFA